MDISQIGCICNNSKKWGVDMQILKYSKSIILMYIFISINVLLSVTNIIYGITRINDNKNFLSSDYIEVTNGSNFNLDTLVESLDVNSSILVVTEPRYDVAMVYYKNYPFTPKIITGRSFEERDFLSGEKVAIISSEAKNKCYEKIGKKYVDFDNEQFLVVGIFDKEDNSINPDSDIFIAHNLNDNKESVKTNEVYIDSTSEKEKIVVWCEANDFVVTRHKQVNDLKEKFIISIDNQKATYIIVLIILILILFNMLDIVQHWYHKQSREVAIRRMLGGTSEKIIAMIAKRYCLIVIISYFLSIPCFLLVTKLGLEFYQGFDVNFNSFIISFLILVVISLYGIASIIHGILKEGKGNKAK